MSLIFYLDLINSLYARQCFQWRSVYSETDFINRWFGLHGLYWLKLGRNENNIEIWVCKSDILNLIIAQRYGYMIVFVPLYLKCPLIALPFDDKLAWLSLLSSTHPIAIQCTCTGLR